MANDVDGKISLEVFAGSPGHDFFKKITNLYCFPASDFLHQVDVKKRFCCWAKFTFAFLHCLPFHLLPTTLDWPASN
jgi:hypothetical protein